jgi:hypothetical protein
MGTTSESTGLGSIRANAWVLAVAVVLGCAVAISAARASDDHNHDEAPGGRFCTATALALSMSCENEVKDDFFRAKALCINLGEADERDECLLEARRARLEARTTCREQRLARRDLCRALGEGRYDPDFDPEEFDDDFENPSHPNPYFPLAIGNRWEFAEGDETIRVEVRAETKNIEGVTCIVVNDRVEVGGLVVEDTDDWYGQAKDGSVSYCGEIASNFEVFEGDDPAEPELVDVDGSWKAGRDGDLPGTQMLAVPVAGDVYRQEFSPGNAEDAARVLSNGYGLGSDPTLDDFVPQALATHLCSANDCVVTGEFTPLEPGTFQRKYYAPGIGLFLEVNPNSGSAVSLVDCNFHAKCAELPAP